MRDWEALVNRHLAGLVLEPAEKAEVIAELAAHLEETCAELRKQGMPEEEAVRCTLSQVQDWQNLRHRIQIARTKENIMTNRVKQFWLPSLLTLVLSIVLYALILIFIPKYWMYAWRGHLPLAMGHIVWLLTLPLIGATGAYLSYRAGGSARAMISSTLFPVVPLLASILIVLPVSLMFDHFIAHNTAPVSLLMAVPGFVLAPGIALLAGGLPAEYFLSRRLGCRRIAGS